MVQKGYIANISVHVHDSAWISKKKKITKCRTANWMDFWCQLWRLKQGIAKKLDWPLIASSNVNIVTVFFLVFPWIELDKELLPFFVNSLFNEV